MPRAKKTTTAEKEQKEKKPRKPTKKTIPAEGEPTNLDIDLNSFDWGEDCKLNDRQKYFVIWFTYPGRTYHNAMQSAIKAGYTKKTANVLSPAIRRNPEISALIKKFDDMYVRESLDDFYHRAITDKIARATFDVNDFHEVKKYTDKDGNEREYLSIKDPSTLTPEQRKCIDGVKFNNNGTPSYEFANRTHEMEVLMKLHEMASGEKKNTESEMELTIEQIKDKVTAKVKVIQKKDEEEELAGKYIDEPDNLIEEI